MLWTIITMIPDVLTCRRLMKETIVFAAERVWHGALIFSSFIYE